MEVLRTPYNTFTTKAAPMYTTFVHTISLTWLNAIQCCSRKKWFQFHQFQVLLLLLLRCGNSQSTAKINVSQSNR
jgi:hypothetical protein